MMDGSEAIILIRGQLTERIAHYETAELGTDRDARERSARIQGLMEARSITYEIHSKLLAELGERVP